MTERLREPAGESFAKENFFFREEWPFCLERILIKAHVLHFHQNFFPLLTSLQSPSSLPPCLPPAPFLLIFPFLSSSHFSLFPFLSSFPPPPLLPRFRTLLCFSFPFPSRSVPSQFVTPLGNKDQVIFNDLTRVSCIPSKLTINKFPPIVAPCLCNKAHLCLRPALSQGRRRLQPKNINCQSQKRL